MDKKNRDETMEKYNELLNKINSFFSKDDEFYFYDDVPKGWRNQIQQQLFDHIMENKKQRISSFYYKFTENLNLPDKNIKYVQRITKEYS